MAGLKVDPTDFVMVRFATKPFFFMRVAHRSLYWWLYLKQINFTEIGDKVYFMLPEELEIYQEITKPLADALAPFSTEIKRKLSAISWMRLKRYRKPFAHQELVFLAEAGVPIIL